MNSNNLITALEELDAAQRAIEAYAAAPFYSRNEEALSEALPHLAALRKALYSCLAERKEGGAAQAPVIVYPHWNLPLVTWQDFKITCASASEETGQ